MHYIGIDLGGTNIVAGLVDENFKIIDKVSKPTLRERHPDEIVLDMINLAKEVMEKNNVTTDEVYSIGVGSPGACDSENAVIVYAGNIQFKNYDLRAMFKKHIDLPVFLGNDANVAALGEYMAGAGKQYKSSVMITLGTGVGGGYVENGEILTGANFKGAELGHISLAVGGEQCTCGRKGCWEAYSSATALIREINKAAKANPQSKLNDFYDGDENHTNAKMVFDAKDLGDKVAEEVIDNYYTYLAEGLVNIVAIFDPEVIILGGGVAAQGEKLITPVIEKMKKSLFGGEVTFDLVTASLGNDAGVIGAALLGYKN